MGENNCDDRVLWCKIEWNGRAGVLYQVDWILNLGLKISDCKLVFGLKKRKAEEKLEKTEGKCGKNLLSCQ